jgi:SAM-dependent methyltransferase
MIEVFSRSCRRLRRDRSATRFARVADLFDHAADELAGRLAESGRVFDRALDLGCRDGRLGRRLPAETVLSLDCGYRFARIARGAQADEDRLPFGDGAFDLIASVGALHTVNDLPGALVQLRRALRPGGRFVAVLPGGEELTPLRRALFEAEELLFGGVHARVHPTLDPREAPSLLQRAGFANPVVDVEPLRLRYRDLFALIADLRAGGETNVLTDRAPRFTRALAAASAARFADLGDDDGRVTVEASLIYLTADAPAS